MENFTKFLTALLKLAITIRIIYLFCMYELYPEQYPLSNLTWWVYFLVFDIWMMTTINNSTKEEDEE